MLASRVGQSAGFDTSYLLRSKTAKGDPILRVDREKDYATSENDQALVLRTEKDGQWDWQPVTDAKQLKEFLAKAAPQDKRENLGLWTDSRSWLIGSRDGEVQAGEVVTMGQAAQNLQLVGSETHYNTQYQQNDSWSNHYAGIDPSRLEVEMRSTPTGELAVFKEPKVVAKSTVEVTTLWGLYGSGWRPAETEIITYGG
jgi:hypothetical protein